MPVTMLTVTAGTGDWLTPGGTLAQGGVIFQPLQEAADGGDIVANAPLTLPVVDGDFVSGEDQLSYVPGQSFLVTERIRGAQNPPPYVVVPTGTTLDLSNAPRAVPGVVSLPYVLASTVGQVGGPAGPLDAGGLIPSSQIPATVGKFAVGAGPLDETTLTDSGMTGTVTLAAGTYEDLLFTVDGLIVPNDGTILRRCKIVANAVDAVRLDANTGLETGRVIEDCEIINPGGRAIAGAGFTATRVYGHQLGDDFAEIGRSHAEPTILDSCKADSFRPLAAAHFDGVQVITQPAAPVIIRGCDLDMTPDAGFTVPADAGSTGAVFVAYDVPVGVGDPDPTRVGKIYVLDSRLRQSSGNYSLVVSGDGVTVARCTIGAGSTAAENITVAHVSGHGNVDLDGNPLVTDIHGSDLGDYLVVDDPRQAGASSGIPETTVTAKGDLLAATAASTVTRLGVGTDGQVLTADPAAATGLSWQTPAASGGTSGTLTVVSGFITTGNIVAVNTAGAWAPIAETVQAIAAVAGDQVSAFYGFTLLQETGTYYDVGVVDVNGARVRLLGSPAFPPDPTYEGMGGVNPDPGVGGVNGRQWFTATTADLVAGQVRFCLAHRSGGTGTLLANAGTPITYTLYNNH